MDKRRGKIMDEITKERIVNPYAFVLMEGDSTAARETDPLWEEKEAIRKKAQTMVVASSVGLYALCRLAWDYAETVADLHAQQKSDRKKEIRALRNLKREYDRFRQPCTRPEMDNAEQRLMERIEEANADNLTKFCNALDMALGKIRISGERKLTVNAIGQCLALLGCAFDYEREISAELKRMVAPLYQIEEDAPGIMQAEMKPLLRIIYSLAHPREREAILTAVNHFSRLMRNDMHEIRRIYEPIFGKQTTV